MTDISVAAQERVKVDRAVALLKLRKGTSNPFKLLAIEYKLKDVPEQILTRAKARLDDEPKPRPKVSPAQATLKSATLTTKATSLGHEMDFSMTVELPTKAEGVVVREGEEEFARDLYGVYFEWWEEIVMDYEFTVNSVDKNDEEAVRERESEIAEKKRAGEGGWEKPWSDIYLINTVSRTFESWNASLEKAKDGTLGSGTHQTEVVDRPGILLGKEGTFKKRTLRFRINAGDATGPVFKGDAIQVLTVEDGKLAGSFYQDSTGTTLKSGMAEAEPMRYRSKVSLELRTTEASAFVKAVEGAKQGCSAFDNRELDQATESAKDMKQQLVVVYKELNEKNRMNAVPLIPSSDQYWKAPASDGGLFVAQLSGGKVKRLYYTDDVEREIDINVLGTKCQFTVRTFEQLPLG
jgi:hypothetical protein